MNQRQIEAWALRIIGCVNAKRPHEDSRVELKGEWPQDHWKAARRIAGHANAARGEPILWLIGVDKDRGVLGAEHQELANWYPKVKAHFDELPPALIIDLNVPAEDKTVVALLFETDRSPFVIKSRDGGIIHREVPWREGTGLRSAHRSDLIKLLAPLEVLPEIEVLNKHISITKAETDEFGNYSFDALYLKIEIYIVPKNNTPVILPFHRCSGWLEIPDVFPRTKFYHLSISPFNGRNSIPEVPTMKRTSSELIIEGPGRVLLDATTGRPDLPEPPMFNAQATIHLLPTNAERPIVLNETVTYPSSGPLSNMW